MRTDTWVIASDDTTHDAHWVFAALRKLFALLLVSFPALTQVFLFSDGGPHHFRLALNFYFAAQLACLYNLDLMWFFHMAYHGKSIYDPEGGAVKTILMYLIRNGTISVECAAQFITWAAKYCTMPTSQHPDKTWNIRLRHFLELLPTEIDRSFSESSQVDDVTGVHQTYVFRTVRDSERNLDSDYVDTRAVACICASCLSFGSSCSALNQCGPWKRQAFSVMPSKKRGDLLLPQLWEVLFRHFAVHFVSARLFRVLSVQVNSRAGFKSPFRTVLKLATVNEVFADKRKLQAHNDARCGCADKDLVLPATEDWASGVDPVVCKVIRAVITALPQAAVSMAPSQQQGQQPGKEQEKAEEREEKASLDISRDLIGRRFQYTFAAHGVCSGEITGVGHKFLHLRYDTDRPGAAAWATSRTDIDEDFLLGDFVLLPVPSA